VPHVHLAWSPAAWPIFIKSLLYVLHCCLAGPDWTLLIMSLVSRPIRRSFRLPRQSEDQVDCNPRGDHMVSRLFQNFTFSRVLPMIAYPSRQAGALSPPEAEACVLGTGHAGLVVE
jgi:hypothetical protein